ncbi:MAG: N-acetylmuramoyl-L-alanine amidase [Candidatus Hydrogenedentota bacterium]
MKYKFSIIILFCFIFSGAWVITGTVVSGLEFNNKVNIDSNEYVAISSFSTEIGASYQYDPILKKISINYNNHYFVIMLDKRVFIIDREEIISGEECLRYNDGQFYINVDTAKYIYDIFTADLQKQTKVEESSAVEKKEQRTNSKLKINTICLDAGHGGDDPGAINPAGYCEKYFTLKVALALKNELLQVLPSINIVTTREDDITVPLEKRPQIASAKGANLYVSIHANSTKRGNKKWQDASGIESYIFSLEATDAEAEALAELENASLETTEELTQRELVLFDLRLNGNTRESNILVNYIHNELISVIPLPDRGIKRARFYVLKKMVIYDTPSVLLELGFLCNKTDYKLMLDDSFIELNAQAIAKGIKKYLDDYNQRYNIE